MDAQLASLGRLLEIVRLLRAPGGCPWDRKQVLSDVPRYLIEESSEVADAVEDARGQPDPSVADELGDVLMNVVFAARIAEEAGGFGIHDVATRICDKLVRRHPHVFASTQAESVEQVLVNWNAIKAAEKAERSSLESGVADAAAAASASPPSRLDSVPRNLPPLERAYELGRKASDAGFDWPDATGALEKVEEELREVRQTIPVGAEALAEEMGDLLFAVINVCRKVGVRPETALRRANRKFTERFRVVERTVGDLEKATLDDMEGAWQAAKAAQHAFPAASLGVRRGEEVAPKPGESA
jgi:MazG family protein